jgi:hypothetical protein
MPSEVPKARLILLSALEGALDPLEAIRQALPLMTRDKYLRQAPISRNKVTKEIRDSVKVALANPNFITLSRDQIGRKFNIAGGRVTEIHQGKYDNL